MASTTSTASSYPTSYKTSGSISGTRYQNAVGKGADTSAASGNDYASSSSSTAYIAYAFEFEGIPENATIDSVECQVKGHAENTSRSTCNLQLYAGSTAKGSVSKFTSTSAQTVTLTTGTWSRSEIDTMTLRFTIGYYGGLVNGATVTVTYTYDTTTYTITSSATGVTIEPTGDTEVLKGEDYVLWIDGADGVTITDNGTDVTSQLVQKQKQSGGTIDAVPERYETGGSINGTNYQSTIGKGYDTSNRTGNDYFSTSQGASGSTWIDYYFDFSEIPSNATIESVTVRVKGHCESTTQSREIANVQLYSGSTAKGEDHDFTSTTDAVATLTAGTWTREELQSAKIRMTIGVYGGLLSGATFSVTYSVPQSGYDTYYEYTLENVSEAHTIVVSVGQSETPKIYFKKNGAWVEAIPYKKINGEWVQQTDVTNVFNSQTNYKKGN